MQIQVASNLHLERYAKVCPQLILRPAAPILALTGNLGNPHQRTYRDLLFYCSRNWDRTIVIGGDLEESRDPHFMKCMSVAEEFQNVRFLNMGRMDFRGITFLGIAHNYSEWIHRQIALCPNLIVFVSHKRPPTNLLPAGSIVVHSGEQTIVEVKEEYRDPLLMAATCEFASDSESDPQSREARLRNSDSAQMR